MKVAVAGGGTAGHIEPAMNIADALARHGVEVVALGTTRGLEQTLVPARGYRLREIPPIPMPRKLSFDLVTLPFRLVAAVQQTSAVLVQEGVDVVVGFGGYVSLPAYLGARRLQIPVVVHEANARPGLANRIGATFAAVVFDTVAGSMRNAQTVGIPIRDAIRHLDREASRDEALAHFGLDAGRPTLLVFGGSQGARRLNDVVVAFAADLIAEGWQVLHAIGMKNQDQHVTDLPHYTCVPYIDRMDLAYAIADAAVTRAGAMTVAELTAVGIPAIYVPLPIGNGEQTLNASAVVRAGGGILIDDSVCTPEALIEAFMPWRSEETRLEAACAAKSVGSTDAAATMVEAIMRIGGTS
jgi:UDP-N-acetylglucosamine--N-acetylmuramyl-(pentapeptide) pyrophosphoryl-undecaprenol N-acetylglucosamine transferase